MKAQVEALIDSLKLMCVCVGLGVCVGVCRCMGVCAPRRVGYYCYTDYRQNITKNKRLSC